ncbi:class I SAM-dependent methyltransferase [Mesorhizobium sp. ZMM04-5]|uniref:Class I SAM-dependent methyltransferase n=1 Tax=Mesorhizobium marinum TaxID=3228790 RepID=A0ABV3QW85_9HYPH
MVDQSKGKALLENAYRISTPEDNVRYYAAVADRYDTDFAEGLGWTYPRSIAEVFREAAEPGDVPIADIGCGTGAVAAELGLPPNQIDGMDISAEMLDLARTKRLYGSLYEIDLTGDLSTIAKGYGALLSAGTFTHGHLGPEILSRLPSICRPGALFVIGVNKVHYEALNFAAVLAAMVRDGRIGEARSSEIKMYDKEGHAHSDDLALILRYRSR